MAKFIVIKKIIENQISVTYEVYTNDLQGDHFFATLNLNNKTINFFRDAKLTMLLGVVDLVNIDNPVKILEVHPMIYWPTIGRLKKALDGNCFPNSLDFCA